MSEFEVAARWWAEWLRKPSTDRMTTLQGNTYLSGTDRDIVDVMAEMAKPDLLSAEQVDDFERYLAAITKRMCMRSGWEKAKTDPHWGSACRVLATDYGAGPELRAAYQLAGGSIKGEPFPIKTVMWIGPGTVKARVGYAGEVFELMAGVSEAIAKPERLAHDKS